MSQPVLSRQQAPKTTSEFEFPVKRRELHATEMQEALMELFIKDPKAELRKLCNKVGYKGINSKAAAIRVFEAVTPFLRNKLDSLMGLHGWEAFEGLLDVIRDPSQPGASVKKNAIDSLMDRIGITKKTEVNVHHEGDIGITILPTKSICNVEDIEYEVVLNPDG